jgi:hypothetical protein
VQHSSRGRMSHVRSMAVCGVGSARVGRGLPKARGRALAPTPAPRSGAA